MPGFCPLGVGNPFVYFFLKDEICTWFYFISLSQLQEVNIQNDTDGFKLLIPYS